MYYSTTNLVMSFSANITYSFKLIEKSRTETTEVLKNSQPVGATMIFE